MSGGRMTIEEAVATLRRAGVTVQPEFWAFGIIRPDVADAEIAAYIADPLGYVAANVLLVSRADLERYLASDWGRPQCCETTKRGSRCAALVTPAPDGTIEGFLAAEGGYCRRHGGGEQGD